MNNTALPPLIDCGGIIFYVPVLLASLRSIKSAEGGRITLCYVDNTAEELTPEQAHKFLSAFGLARVAPIGAMPRKVH